MVKLMVKCSNNKIKKILNNYYYVIKLTFKLYIQDEKKCISIGISEKVSKVEVLTKY